MPITEHDIEAYKDALKAFEAEKKMIINRVDEIIKIIGKVFDKKTTICWWFYGAEEGKVGDLDSCIVSPDYKDGSDEIEFTMYEGQNMETDEWDYSYSFPRKFLFMVNKDIRAEIRGHIKQTEINGIKEQEELAQRDTEKKKHAAAAAKKLTKEEKAALGIK